MKKFLNITLIVIVFCLSGTLGCQGLLGSKNGVQEDSVQVEDSRPVAGYDSTTLFEQLVMPGIGTNDTIAVQSNLVSINETGSNVISRTYPRAECGMVQVDKVMPKEVGIDKTFNYTINITNLTDSVLTDISIVEDYSPSFRFISANPVAQEGTNKLTWEIGSLGAKATKQIKISGMASYAEPIRHLTTVVTPVIPMVSSVEVVQPRLTLVKTAPSEALLCDMIPLRYVVTNAGTGTVTGVKIVDSLPAGLRTTDGKAELIFEAGSLSAGQSREFSVELRATRTGTYYSKAQATSGEGLRTESDETSIVVGQPILTINKSGPERLYIGRPVTYEITVSNKSDVSARDTIVEDALPEGVSSVQASAGAKLEGSKLVWNLGILAPNSNRTLTISYIPGKPGTIVNDASASAYCAEPVTASMRTVVTGIAAIMLEVVDIEDPIRVGNRATYMIRVTNQGSAVANNIRISCILEDNVKYISSAGVTAGSSEADTVRFLPLGSLEPQSVAVWRVVVAAVSPGDVRFKVSMSSDDLTRPVEESESTHIYE